MRGRTGAVVMMQASKSDDSLTASTLLANSFSITALQQIQYVAADNPSEKYWQALRSVCPGVQALMLDTTHLAMTWEYANSRRRSKGSAMLRQVLKKFLVVDFSLSAASFGSFYSGGRCKPLDTLELKFQNWIEDGCMKNAEAERILKNLDFERPFYVRLEWIQALAAIANTHREEMLRTSPGPNRKVWQLLHSASMPERTEWYFNNIRVRHSLSRSTLRLLPAGTTSNESLHKEINRWFKETQKLHQATLHSKLEMLQLGKLLSHNRALYFHTSKQIPHGTALARASRQQVWTAESWAAWCAELDDEQTIRLKAETSREDARSRERNLFSQAATRKPSAALPASKHRRTPYTLERTDAFVRQGKKSQ